MGGYVVVGQIIVASVCACHRFYRGLRVKWKWNVETSVWWEWSWCDENEVVVQKTSHDQRMLQALQGSKGQLYKTKCRNFTVRVKLINKKIDDQHTPQVLQGLEIVQKKLQSFSVMGVKLLVKSLCYLMANISHRLIDTCIKWNWKL